MLVQCPNCFTRYRVPDSSVVSSKPVFRCTRCKHVFSLGGGAETLLPKDSASFQPPAETEEQENRELTFSFPPAAEAKVFEETPERSGSTFPVEEPANFDEPEAFPPAGGEAAESPPPRSGDGIMASSTSVSHESLSTKPYLSLFGVLVLFYFLITIFHASHPEHIEGLLRQVPWIGAAVFRNSHLKQGIALESLRPGFYRIVGNREVFVLSGVAVNQNSVSVREVRVEGAIYDREGKEIESHTIALGNPISARIIRDLTAQEVSILQKLNPQKGFEISPEQSREFAIVFLKPAGEEIASFACRISAAAATT